MGILPESPHPIKPRTVSSCALCGDPLEHVGGSLGRRLPVCCPCAAALEALEHGHDDPLAILRGGRS